MRSSRGMGDVRASKMPKGVKKARRDNTDFTQYAKGGKIASNAKSKSKFALKTKKGK